ncbi:hypothetical protein HFO91_30515 [Rhizobium leguminosarum]|uniref:hypothetical protein n=1 Tax=Rhizobium leguminosarum TaxID=384 RepID=UPI001C9525E0|nr:hypothetical protein [Rhizobium leguminosarum]MBY5453914.1 hypothetical protein [Rhizobium leguminosarum]
MTDDEYGPSSIKVLADMEPPRKRPTENIGGTTEEYDHFARQVGLAADENFTGRELIENWDHELMLAVSSKAGPDFLYDRTAAEILQVAGVFALMLAGRFQLAIKEDRELSTVEAAWYLGSYPVLVTRHMEAGSLKSLRLSDLAPFKIEQDRVGRLITEINDELAWLDEPTEGPKP